MTYFHLYFSFLTSGVKRRGRIKIKTMPFIIGFVGHVFKTIRIHVSAGLKKRFHIQKLKKYNNNNNFLAMSYIYIFPQTLEVSAGLF